MEEGEVDSEPDNDDDVDIDNDDIDNVVDNGHRENNDNEQQQFVNSSILSGDKSKCDLIGNVNLLLVILISNFSFLY